VRLIQKRCHYSLDQAKALKIKGGVPPTAFVDFLVKDNKSYSLKELTTFNQEDHKGPIALGRYLK